MHLGDILLSLDAPLPESRSMSNARRLRSEVFARQSPFLSKTQAVTSGPLHLPPLRHILMAKIGERLTCRTTFIECSSRCSARREESQLRPSHSFAFLLLIVVSLRFCTIVRSQAVTVPKKYAVVVGVNVYEHPRLEPLRFAKNDAVEMAALLRSKGYQVSELTADAPTKPTKKEIESALDHVLTICKSDDTVVICFAGHGLQFEDKPIAYYCPVDARPFADQPTRWFRSRISTSEWTGVSRG